mmetsp:Transcript_23403/g.73736  ORF Transcript_23403/g.73736 Transcript_23403/m.73736 type:complete len:204 (+) Transcript_23403:672-1283(+)
MEVAPSAGLTRTVTRRFEPTSIGNRRLITASCVSPDGAGPTRAAVTARRRCFSATTSPAAAKGSKLSAPASPLPPGRPLEPLGTNQGSLAGPLPGVAAPNVSSPVSAGAAWRGKVAPGLEGCKASGELLAAKPLSPEACAASTTALDTGTGPGGAGEYADLAAVHSGGSWKSPGEARVSSVCPVSHSTMRNARWSRLTGRRAK